MKRILSLALVLVMLVSVMPFALADTEHSHSGTEGTDWNWVKDEEASTPATCKNAGSNVYKCSVEGCPMTKTEPVDPLSHTDENNDFICDECEADLRVNVTVTATADKPTLKVNETATITLNYANLPEGKEITGATWKSSDETVATVTNGTVKALKKGTATITVSGLTAPDGVVLDKTSVDVAITVTDGPTIVFPADQTTQTRYTSLATITLKPGLSEKVEGEVTWTYETSSTTATVDKNGVVDPSAAGAVEVTITAAWGDPAAKASTQTKVSVSFYDIVDATVSVASKATTFGFWDTDVFSSVSIDNSSVALPSGYSMANLWSSKISYTDVKLSPENKTNSAAQISYKNSAIQSPTSIPKVNERTIVFTCLSKGTFEFEYELFHNGLLVRYGVITVYTVEGGADLTYKTTFNKNVVFDEDDFVKLWNKSSNKSKLDYVQFTTNTLVGDLYVSSEKNAYAVSSNMKFYYDYNSAIDKGFNDYDLDLVTYVPYSKATKAYEETISFTCVGETFSETLSGVLVIKVGNTMNFTDVKTTDYFYDAVVWAVDQGVTSGTSATTFSPNKTCSRAEVVTFLWRAAGEPKPTSTYMPFSDVKVTDYYYDAVRWAVEEKVTTGTSATTFSPNATVTRGQVVTFLYRALKASSVSTTNPFTDVKSGEYYYDAVLWAVKNDVTNGLTATTFGPNTGCTRGQIVTFLYRAYEG